MTTQTTYSEKHAKALPGLQGSMVGATIISRTNASATAIGFGKVVDYGTGDNECVPHAAAGKPLGISLIDPTLPVGNADTYKRYDTVEIMEDGEVWVTVGAAVEEGDPVYYVDATGVFTNVAGGGANIRLGTSEYRTAAGNGALALVRVRQ